MKSKRPLILLTNDDGILSEGITVLEGVLLETADVVTVAPDRARSGTSHALTLGEAIYVKQEGPNRFSTTGTPTDCVNIGVHRLLPRKPDLVVSGINIGGNLCEDVTYSGTVAAALEATLLGIPSLAFSLASRGEFLFVPAAPVARDLCDWILARGLPPGVLLNINIPNLVDGSRPEVRWTRLGNKYYSDVLEEGVDEDGRSYFRFGKDPLHYLEGTNGDEGADVDWKAVEQGFISITPLRLDTTDEGFLRSLLREEGSDLLCRM